MKPTFIKKKNKRRGEGVSTQPSVLIRGPSHKLLPPTRSWLVSPPAGRASGGFPLAATFDINKAGWDSR